MDTTPEVSLKYRELIVCFRVNGDFEISIPGKESYLLSGTDLFTEFIHNSKRGLIEYLSDNTRLPGSTIHKVAEDIHLLYQYADRLRTRP